MQKLDLWRHSHARTRSLATFLLKTLGDSGIRSRSLEEFSYRFLKLHFLTHSELIKANDMIYDG